MMVFDSSEELKKIKTIYPKARLLLRIKAPSCKDVEINLSVQYGCQIEEAPQLLRQAKEISHNVIGVSFHVGSGITDGRVFAKTFKQADLVFDMAREAGFSLSLLDVGGGFLGNKKRTSEFEKVAAGLNKALDEYFPCERGVKIIAEPGRYFVCSAQTLALPIVGKKVISEADECRRMYFLNDGRFGSFHVAFRECCFTNKPEVVKPPVSSVLYRSTVWGPSLTGLHCIFEDCELPDLEIGDWVYLENMGAYTLMFSRGDTNFNGVEIPKLFYVCHESYWKEINYFYRL